MKEFGFDKPRGITDLNEVFIQLREIGYDKKEAQLWNIVLLDVPTYEGIKSLVNMSDQAIVLNMEYPYPTNLQDDLKSRGVKVYVTNISTVLTKVLIYKDLIFDTEKSA